MDVLEELIEEIDRGNCIAFIGSGLSQSAGFPSWSELAQQMLDWSEKSGVQLADRSELAECIAEGDMLLVVDELRKRLGEEDLSRFLLEIVTRLDTEPSYIQRLIPQIPFSAVWTMNYDNLLEDAYMMQNGKMPIVFTHSDFGNLHSMLKEDRFYMLKMHGTIGRPETLLLLGKDYRRMIRANRTYLEALKNIFATKTVLFMGFALRDPDFVVFLREMSELSMVLEDSAERHYALVCTHVERDIELRRLARDWKLKIIPYHDISELQVFLSILAEHFRGRSKEEPGQRPMTIAMKIPIERTYYQASPAEPDRVLCWIPRKELEVMFKEGQVAGAVLENYPHGIEIDVSEEALKDAGLELKINAESICMVYDLLKHRGLLPESGYVSGSVLEIVALRIEAQSQTRGSVAILDSINPLPMPAMSDGEDPEVIFRRLAETEDNQ